MATRNKLSTDLKKTTDLDALAAEWIAYNNDGGKLTWAEYKANAGF